MIKENNFVLNEKNETQKYSNLFRQLKDSHSCTFVKPVNNENWI